MEMIKGIVSHACDSVLKIPIINNQASELLLASDLDKVVNELMGLDTFGGFTAGPGGWGIRNSNNLILHPVKGNPAGS